jgi:predicted anti-sigma-YlaC factor YlaD
MVCCIYRWIIACSVDSAGTLGPAVQRHLGSCAACRRYYHAQQRVSDALKQQVSLVAPSANPILPDRIMASLSADGPAPGVRHERRVFRFTTYRTVAACLLIVLGLMIPVMRTTMQNSDGLNTDHPSLATVATLQQQLVPEQLMSAYAFLVQDSLESEMNNLSTDARRAARFLVQCTPSHGGMVLGTSLD